MWSTQSGTPQAGPPPVSSDPGQPSSASSVLSRCCPPLRQPAPPRLLHVPQGCDDIVEAQRLMGDFRWQRRVQEGERSTRALCRGHVRTVRVAHALCADLSLSLSRARVAGGRRLPPTPTPLP
eukprot:806230-Prymnesium_polylepis.1